MPFNFCSTKYNYRLTNRGTFIGWSILLFGFLLLPGGCGLMLPGDAQSDDSPPKQQQKSPTVDIAIARQGSLERDTQYIGTTFPVREVSLRSRIEGQVLDLNVDLGRNGFGIRTSFRTRRFSASRW